MIIILAKTKCSLIQVNVRQVEHFQAEAFDIPSFERMCNDNDNDHLGGLAGAD